MPRRKLGNVTFIVDEYFEPFTIDDYKFYSKYSQPVARSAARSTVTTARDISRHNRRYSYNAYVEFDGRQEDSIIFNQGTIDNKMKNREMKFIHDILVLGSILTGNNWTLFSLRYYPEYPVTPTNHLDYICRSAGEIEEYLSLAVSKIKEKSWQTQFENGFHLRMLLNRSNILHIEARFLSNVVIWEWLYAHLKGDESWNLKVIFRFILKRYWKDTINEKLFTEQYGSIFYFLRNQLAHSGKLPINRKNAEPWMKSLEWDGIEKYIKFFNRLTQIVVLKTLGINAENRLDTWNFSAQLDCFLTTGKIDK